MRKLTNKRGFTLVELIVVMAIISVLVLFAVPKFMNYREEAVLTQIKSDTRAIENNIQTYMIKHSGKLPEGLEVIDITLLDTAISEGSFYDYTGKVDSYEHDKYSKVEDRLNSKLKGDFVVSEEGKVYYIHDKAIDVGDEGNGPYVPAGYTLATDSDFQYITDSSAPNIYEGGQKGYYKYIGTAEYVAIPHKIKGNDIKDYYRMFDGSSVKGVASSNPNVTDMSWMFRDSKATTLDLSSFDTSNVTNMSNMFYSSKATTLNLSSFDTSKVTNMSWMFRSSETTTLNLSSFNTSNVTDMSYMFNYSQATTFDLSSFNTSNVTDMSYMFNYSQATTLDLSSFNTSKVTNMRWMFNYSQATTLDLSSFDTSNVIDMSAMFYGSKVTTLNLSSFNTSKVTDMSNMFGFSKATTLDLSSFDTSNVTDMSRMFRSSKATTGYARTQADADRFNGSSNKPAGLTFIVK